jgi:glucose-6-phosphate 1-epimerase
LIFPQFGGLGTLPKHGFARTSTWELLSLGGDSDSATAEFGLTDNPTTRLLWPYAFMLKMKVSIRGMRMTLILTVENPGDQPYSFTTALHTYLHVDNILTTVIEGLHGLRYHDTVNRPTPADWVERIQTDPKVSFSGEVDRVYDKVSEPLRVCESDRMTRVTASGFSDTVIWNPGPEKAAKLTNLEPDGYLHMVCVEAAIVDEPITLAPGETWKGSQVLSA